ncbi:MAG TPA: TetR/AcrR family transcriptional regulator [Steroidobacteraceae bacterium]|nr:TetR/AcrR family transcriptional regulator [Steroidobacteraceae bacterium]
MSVKRKRRSYRSDVRAAAVDETRARIVAASHRLLSGGKNLPAFSIDAVARAAGVTRLTVYNQFESRRGLLEAVFDDMALRGGLFELPSVMAEADALRALRRVVAVFCHFWASHGSAYLTFSALTKLDEEVGAALKQRTERRRRVLTALVSRLSAVEDPDSVVDVLFVLTSFETFDALCTRKRSHAAVETLIWRLVETIVQ